MGLKPTAPSTPLEQQRDAALFQAWIRRRQYPAHCSTSTGAITRQDYFFVLGLGAQMVSMKFNLVHALLQGMVYYFPTTHYTNPLRCPSRSFECYFEPPTNCSKVALQRQQEVKIHWCFDLPRRRLSRMAKLTAVHSSAWYHAQLAAFLFRPNAAMREYSQAVRADMEFANVLVRLLTWQLRSMYSFATPRFWIVLDLTTTLFLCRTGARHIEEVARTPAVWRCTSGEPTNTPRTIARRRGASVTFYTSSNPGRTGPMPVQQPSCRYCSARRTRQPSRRCRPYLVLRLSSGCHRDAS